MRRQYKILLFILTFGLFANCSSSVDKKEVQEVNDIQTKTENDSIKTYNNNDNGSTITKKAIKKYKEKEILNLLGGKYVYDEGCCYCKFELEFKLKNEKLNYHIKTEKRKINGIAKISIHEDGRVYIIFPIEWDDYQGDMTLDTYEQYTGEKPQNVSMRFDPELKTIMFQNYGNAMNNYIIFDECGNDKAITLKNEKSNR